jgi:hypothetical protein
MDMNEIPPDIIAQQFISVERDGITYTRTGFNSCGYCVNCATDKIIQIEIKMNNKKCIVDFSPKCSHPFFTNQRLF